MNKTVEIVNLWGQYEVDHPDATIEDFCRHLLTSKRESAIAKPVSGGPATIPLDGHMLRTLGKITKLNMLYANLALKGTGLNQIEEFAMLMTIEREKNPRKTEVIYDNLQELSSGTDMVNRLIKRGFVTEHNDKIDKRAKRLQLTASGQKAIGKCMGKIVKCSRMMLLDMNKEDKQLVIQLLKDVEKKFQQRWPKDKAQKFEEIYEDVMEKGKRE